jgi:predicted class III extradiol MEMO1 family dioxygenase
LNDFRARIERLEEKNATVCGFGPIAVAIIASFLVLYKLTSLNKKIPLKL